MATASNISAWIAFALGLYALAAGIGMLTAPERFKRMAWELDRSAALGFLVGITVFALGMAIVLVNPWDGDWLAKVVTIIGIGMAVEGLAFIAFPKVMGHISRGLLDGERLNSLWAILSLFIGAILAFSGVLHLQLVH